MILITERGLSEDYFNWLSRFISSGTCNDKKSYSYLFLHLYQTDYIYDIEMDRNRYEDGIGLRYRFSEDVGCPLSAMERMLDSKKCSLLEMMIALSMRCENYFPLSEENGIQIWFMNMIDNLKLGTMINSRYDPFYVNKVLYSFMYHEYSQNGEGGLFTVNDCPYDLRNEELWNQCMWYLNTIIS